MRIHIRPLREAAGQSEGKSGEAACDMRRNILTLHLPRAKMTEYEKFHIAAVMKTVAPRNILTERRPCAERAAVRRKVKITSEPDTLREMG